MNYTDYIATVANLLVVPTTDANFVQILPSIINDAEQRIYRELDLLDTIVRDTSGTLTANSRNFTFPQHVVVSESLNVFSPAGTQTTRNQLVPVSREWLDAVWGNEASTTTPSIPQYYAMITDQTIIVGPPPDANYTVEVVATIRPTPISATNPTTYLSLYLPDLFVSASMVFGSGYLKDFGAAVDDPKMALTWQSHYDAEFASANTEESMRHRDGRQRTRARSARRLGFSVAYWKANSILCTPSFSQSGSCCACFDIGAGDLKHLRKRHSLSLVFIKSVTSPVVGL